MTEKLRTAFEETMRIRRLRGMCVGSMLCSIFVAAAPMSAAAQEPAQLPDSPSAVIAQQIVEARLLRGQTSSSSAASPAASQQTQSETQSSPIQKPVGTAAAETPPTTGFAASNPSGAAIAPAKQKRARTILIRVSAILGAGVAVGTVAALASASPSKPPGSH
jgi:hypothetical protein